MDKTKRVDEMNLAALEETLKAAELLLPVEDLDKNKKAAFIGQERMGYPCAILLCCFIEAVGHRVLNKEYAKTFEILADKEWFGITPPNKNTFKELYSVYRNKLCHNLVIPYGFRIDANPANEIPFQFDAKTGLVVVINLYALIQTSKVVFHKFQSQENSRLFTYPLNSSIQMSLTKDLGDVTSLETRCPSGETDL